MRRLMVLVATLAVGVMPSIALPLGSVPVAAVDARTSVPDGMCSLWTTKQASSAMKESMKVVREDPDYCVWYSKKDHSGSISTLSANLESGDPSSDLSLLEQARRQAWRRWRSEDTIAGVPMLLTDVRRFGKNREITSAAFPDDVTWVTLAATSVIGANVRTAVRRMVEAAAPAFAAAAGASATPSAAPDATAGAPSDGPATACMLLTLDEVSSALGEVARQGVDVPEQCIYSTDGGSMLQVILLTSGPGQTQSMLERRQEDSPDATTTEIGGYPALFGVGVLMGPSVYVYPSSDVELELELATTQELDAHAVLAPLAEVAVGRLVQAGLPVAPTPEPTVATSGGLCSILSADEASAALGGADVSQALADADGCAYLAESTSLAVYLEVLRGDRASEMRQQIAVVPDQFEAAGMPAVQVAMPPASIVVILPDDSTAVQLTVSTPEGVDATAAARALAELVAPRLRTYLGV